MYHWPKITNLLSSPESANLVLESGDSNANSNAFLQDVEIELNLSEFNPCVCLYIIFLLFLKIRSLSIDHDRQTTLPEVLQSFRSWGQYATS